MEFDLLRPLTMFDLNDGRGLGSRYFLKTLNWHTFNNERQSHLLEQHGTDDIISYDIRGHRLVLSVSHSSSSF